MRRPETATGDPSSGRSASPPRPRLPSSAAHFLLLFSLFLLHVAPVPVAANFFPCHPAKSVVDVSVGCTRVVLPSGLCSRCPLRPTLSDGSFADCQRIYDTSAATCLPALRAYVALNPCDGTRARVLAALEADAGDVAASRDADYFLYAVCENCCDCVPMGVSVDDYDALAAAHGADGVPAALWKEDRGNCPAHAVFDVCKVLPHVTHFAREGNAPAADADALPKVCPLLEAWKNSPAASEWQTNPQTTIVTPVRDFLRGLLVASECADKGTWTRCAVMEGKQNHLNLPGGGAGNSGGGEPDNEDTENDNDDDEQADSGSSSPSAGSSNNPSPSTATEDAASSVSEVPSLTSTPSISATAVTSAIAMPLPSLSPSPSPSSLASVDSSSSPSPSSSTAAEPSPQPAACFPADATVRLADGSRRRMDALRVGDVVDAGNGAFSAVFMFSHRDAGAWAEHVEMALDVVSNRATECAPADTAGTIKSATTTDARTRTSCDATHGASATNETGRQLTLTLSPGHLLPVWKNQLPARSSSSWPSSWSCSSSAAEAPGLLTPARLVVRGDRVRLACGGWAAVRGLRPVRRRGLYNPHTVAGSLAVDGVVASVYTEAVAAGTATALLAPVRAAFRAATPLWLWRLVAETALAKGGTGLPQWAAQALQ